MPHDEITNAMALFRTNSVAQLLTRATGKLHATTEHDLFRMIKDLPLSYET